MITQSLPIGTLSSETFVPTDIADLVLWLDAADLSTLFQVAGSQPFGAGSTAVTSDGQTVASWLDKSGNDNHMNQGAAAWEPTYKTGIINSLPVVRAIDAATDDLLFSTSSVLSQDQAVTVFYIAAATGDETLGGIYSNSNTNTLQIACFVESITANRRGCILEDSSGSAVAVNPADIATEANQFTTVIDSQVTARLNGSAGTPVAKAGDGVTTNDYTRIFSQRSDLSPFYGDLGELLVYDATLSGADIALVEAYLQGKWATP